MKMKFFVAFAFLASGCVSPDQYAPQHRAETITRARPSIIDGFSPREEVVYRMSSYTYSDSGSYTYLIGWEPNLRLAYSLHVDGSGSVETKDKSTSSYSNEDTSVSLACRTDKISDNTECTYRAGELLLFGPPSGRISGACILSHDFPGRRGAVRVGKNPPVRTDGSGCINAAATRNLLRQMEGGGEIITQFVEWPYDYNKTTTTQLSSAILYSIQLRRWAHQNPNKVVPKRPVTVRSAEFLDGWDIRSGRLR